jgi:Protein of unknown function (DUF2934)
LGQYEIAGQGQDTSDKHTPTCDEIRLRAYEIYLERDGLPGDELDDWLRAERELGRPAPQKGETTEIQGRRS